MTDPKYPQRVRATLYADWPTGLPRSETPHGSRSPSRCTALARRYAAATRAVRRSYGLLCSSGTRPESLEVASSPIALMEAVTGPPCPLGLNEGLMHGAIERTADFSSPPQTRRSWHGRCAIPPHDTPAVGHARPTYAPIGLAQLAERRCDPHTAGPP